MRCPIRQHSPLVGPCLWSHSTPDVFLWSNIWKTAGIISTRLRLIYRPSCECLHSFRESRSDRDMLKTSPHLTPLFGKIKKNTYFKNRDLLTKDNTCLWQDFIEKCVGVKNKKRKGSTRPWALINKRLRVKLEQSELRPGRKMKLFLV